MPPHPNDIYCNASKSVGFDPAKGSLFWSNVLDQEENESRLRLTATPEEINGQEWNLNQLNSYGRNGNSDEYHSRPHMCETCGKRFTLLENLTRHHMIHTDERPFVCSYCNKRFRLAQHLKEHVRIHTGEKPYKCPTCGRAFCQISNLKSHQKTHTKIKAFKCDICEKSFRRSFTLKQHKLTHTRRSYSGPIGGSHTDLSEKSEHHKLTRNLSAPMPAIVHTDDVIRSQSRAERESEKVSHSTFSSSLMSAYGFGTEGIQFPPTTGYQAGTYLPPSSSEKTHLPLSATIMSPARSTEQIKQEPQDIPSTSATPNYPSLSALLRPESRGSVLGETCLAPSPDVLRYYRSLQNTADSRFTVISPFYSERAVPTTPSYHVKPPHVASSTENTCIHCGGKFSDLTSLRDHVINQHSRKDQRRDSAYSSHSDKSPTSSPNMRKSSSAPITSLPKVHDDVTSMASVRRISDDSAFMQRVKELALRSLGKSPNKSNVTKSPPTTQCDEEVISVVGGSTSDDVVCPDVGHSPTEQDDHEKAAKSKESAGNSSMGHDCERKFIKRAADGSKKWKRQLCKEWYHLPESCEQNDNQKTEEKKTESQRNERNTKDNDAPQEKRIKRENVKCPEYSDMINSTAPQCITEDSKTKELSPSDSFDYRRFAPVVEWKPVVTGWKDMICGTLYAVPPHMQPNIFGAPTTPLIDPRFLYSQADFGDAKKSDDASPPRDSAANFFRFSPHTIHNFALGGDITVPVTPDSGSSGVYTSFYPPETLPISGYSRLQHALLYQWDPSRTRLGGTSTVPQSANLVSAT